MTVNNSLYKEWLNLENNQNGIRARASNVLATYSQFPKEYQPGAAPYEMTFYEVATQVCTLFISHSPDPDLKKAYFFDDKVRFAFHPVNADNPEIPHIKEFLSNPKLESGLVSPTSSTRTVFVLNSKLPPHCLKPHTDLVITKWRRHMEERKVKQAVCLTRIFEESSVFNNYSKVAYYPESIGVVYKGGHHKDWGFIIREMRSKPYINTTLKMVPFCSLYLPGNDAEKNPPLLLELIKATNRVPKDFILQEVLFPLLTGWFKIYEETGVLLEPHGQNVVVEIDDETDEIVRFAHRDFDAETNIDIAKAKGFDVGNINVFDQFTTEENRGFPRGTSFSIIFDNSVKVPLEGIADLAQSYWGVKKEELRSEVRQFLHRTFPDIMENHLPKPGTSHRYAVDSEGKKFIEAYSYDPNQGWR